MVEASSLGLADSLTEEERESDLLYPRLERIREISAFIATRVIRKAQAEVHSVLPHLVSGPCTDPLLPGCRPTDRPAQAQ